MQTIDHAARLAAAFGAPVVRVNARREQAAREGWLAAYDRAAARHSEHLWAEVAAEDEITV